MHADRFIHARAALFDMITHVLAPPHYPSRFAPDTWERLQWYKTRLTIGPLPVWNGASENSIYFGSMGNYAFRAWHDQVHLDMGLDFSDESEVLVALEQAKQLRMLGADDDTVRVFMADTVGQHDYLDYHEDEFPVDQHKFVFEYLWDGDATRDC